MTPLNSTLQRWLGAGALALLLPVAASAQQAYANSAVNLRAGPATNYPVVAVVGSGQNFEVLGCTQGYGWCDVVMPDGLRGWIYSAAIDYAYQQERVPLATYGAAIGIPIVGFAIANYWGNNYRDRSWYDDRRWWGNRPPPPRDGWRRPAAEQPNWRPRDWQGPRPGRGNDFRPRPDYQPPNSMRPQPPQGYRPPRDEGVRPGRDPGMRPPREGMRPDRGERPPGMQGQPQQRPQRPQMAPQQQQPQRTQMAPPQQQQQRPQGGPPRGGAEGRGGGGGGGGGGGQPANSMRPG